LLASVRAFLAAVALGALPEMIACVMLGALSDRCPCVAASPGRSRVGAGAGGGGRRPRDSSARDLQSHPPEALSRRHERRRSVDDMRAALSLVAVAALVAGCGGDGDRLASGDLPRAPAALRVSSPAFIDGARVPQRYTCDGAGEEPPVQAGTVPPSARELVLVVSDPDAPGGTYVHVTRLWA
jgi:hypothetical protein